MKADFAQSVVSYLDTRGLEDLQVRKTQHVLGVLGYGEHNGFAISPSVPHTWTGLRTLEPGPRFETWLSSVPVAVEHHPGIRVAHNDEVLFGMIEFDAGSGGEFQALALEHYLRLFALVDAHGYPHLLRIWHYLPQIHLEENGLERYKRFSVARHEAFVRSGRNIGRDAPAASAVGKRAGTTVIAFLAGRRPATPIENPRQMSAYHYPAQYGPRGPTFARAAYVAWGPQEQLYVSGTASIVGHESRHVDDAERQADETIHNLCALLGEAQARTPARASGWERLLFKVYLRPGVGAAQVVDRLRSTFGDEPDVLVLEAEICRHELLLEIEAIALRERAAAA